MVDHNKERTADVAKRAAQQEKQIRELQARVERLSKTQRNSGGGFPWGTALLVLGGYYVWRNDTLRNKLMDTVENASPGAREHLERAGSALREGIKAVQQGEPPQKALTTVVNEVSTGLRESTVGKQAEVRRVAAEVQRDSNQAVSDAREAAQEFTTLVEERLDEERSKNK